MQFWSNEKILCMDTLMRDAKWNCPKSGKYTHGS